MSASLSHVAVFVRSLDGGGAERNMLHLAEGIAARGPRVDLVLARRAGAFASDVPGSVRCVDLGGPQPLRAAAAAWRDRESFRVLAPVVLSRRPPAVLGAVPAFADYLRAEQPDVVFSALAYSNVAAIIARRAANVATRVVVSERNIITARALASNVPRMRRLPEVLKHFYPQADAISAVSDGVGNDLARCTGIARECIVTTYSPIVHGRMLELAKAPAPHPWLDERATPVVLAVGKLKPQKGFDLLLKAFSRVLASRSARLLVLGKGPLEARLRAQAVSLGVADRVAFLGFVANPFAAMARAGVFVLSSVWEGLPSVLIQAMACGAPVVSTDCPAGPAEILDGGALAPLVPVGDVAALAESINAVLASRPDTTRLQRKAEAFAVAPVLDRTWPLLDGTLPVLRTKPAS